MNKVRTTVEIQKEIEAAMVEAETLNRKAQDNDITPEETDKFVELTDSLAALEQEHKAARASEDVQSFKARRAEPVRSAPKYQPRAKAEQVSHAEALKTWLQSHTAEADVSHNAYERTAPYGYSLGTPSANVKVNYDRLNFKKRTVLSTTGVGTGKEYIPVSTYSDKVVEVMTYSSPIVGIVGSETTSDGNKRTYFKFDDSDLMSTYITDSGGSEVNPTIPDVNITTASVDISTFSITSGYHKITYQELRDSAVDLESKIARAIGNAHARRIEHDMINGTGNGTTGVQGLLAVDHSIGSVSAGTFAASDLEALYFSMPQAYRENMVFLYSDATAAVMRSAFVDQTGRSLFDKNIVDGVEWPTILGKRCYQSIYMPDDLIVCFNPDLYMLRMVTGATFAVLKERFFPHTALCGLMDFGGAWLGATGASGQCHSLTLTS